MSYLEKAVEISTAPENYEGDNWDDWVNLCGEADLEINHLTSALNASEKECKLNASAVVGLGKENRAKDKEIAKLKEALEEYGSHELYCTIYDYPTDDSRRICTCGFEQALADNQTPTPAPS